MDGQDIEQKITELEDQANKFHEDLKYLEAIDTLEELLVLKKEEYGTTGPEFTKTCRQLCEISNILSVFYLKKDATKQAYDILKKSEALWDNNELGKAMTYNNMAWYYRRVGKLRTALKFLEQALSIESRLNKIDTQADTHLNIWAVLSQLNKHALALNHAMSAVILLQEDLLFKAVNGDKKDDDDDDPIELKTKNNKDPNKDRKSVLAIAYHNMGVEQEFLRSYHAAIMSYKKAVNFAEKNLGPDNGITENLRNVYENARSELDPSFKKKKPTGKKKKGDRLRMQQDIAGEDQDLPDTIGHHEDEDKLDMEGEHDEDEGEEDEDQ